MQTGSKINKRPTAWPQKGQSTLLTSDVETGLHKGGKVVPTSVKAGDRVLLPGWGGSPIKLGEEVSLMCCQMRDMVGC